MPIDYSKYPPNWKTEIRPRILERAKKCCQHCGVPNYAVGHRDDDGKFHPTGGNVTHDQAGAGELTYSKAKELVNHCQELDENHLIIIVLTIAHLDHDEENHNVKDERLAALCQRCHLKYDAKEKVRRRKAKKYLNSFFPL